MSEEDETQDGLDIIISGPDDGGEIDSGEVEGGGKGSATRLELLKRHVYRIDFADGSTKAYVASDDVYAIRLAESDKPGVDRVQISRIHSDAVVGRVVRVRGEEV